MVGVTGKIPVGRRRILMGFYDEVDFSSSDDFSLPDMVLGFFDGDGSIESCSTSDGGVLDEEEEGNEGDYAAERKEFWDGQHQFLQATLTRSSSLESGIRNAIKVMLKDYQSTGTVCSCRPRSVSGGCRTCLLNDVSRSLRNAGYDSAICKSKWRSSPHIPAGEHSFIDVLDTSKKGEPIRVVIELNFRAEFEMARASEEYNKLNNRLPEVYVGRADRLKALIKIMCSAAKRCMKENKMHMGPWRKQKYMEAKWFGSCERTTSSAPVFPRGFPEQPKKQSRTSLLKFDIGGNLLPPLQCRPVEVVVN